MTKSLIKNRICWKCEKPIEEEDLISYSKSGMCKKCFSDWQFSGQNEYFFSPYGLFIDVTELKKHTHIVIWAQIAGRDGTLRPWVTLKEFEIGDLGKKAIIGTYISCEVRP